jgi:hypothetical protein
MLQHEKLNKLGNYAWHNSSGMFTLLVPPDFKLVDEC